MDLVWKNINPFISAGAHRYRNKTTDVLVNVPYNTVTVSLLARGPLRRGAQFDEIGQKGLKPALVGNPGSCIHDASGQREAAEQYAADRLPVFQRKDTDRIWLSCYSRGSQPGVHVPLGVHFLYSLNKLTLLHKKGVYLYSSKNRKVLLKVQWIFVISLGFCHK